MTVDTGGTKTLVAAFNRRGQLGGQNGRFATPKDPREYLVELTKAITTVSNGSTIDAICIGIPGAVKKGVVLWAFNLGWENVSIGSNIEKRFACPVYFENDANLAGLAEAHALPKVYDNVMYLTFSTGIGMGLIINHTILTALSVTEPGHMMVEYDGKLRKWEDIASGRAIKATYNAYARDIHDPKVWAHIAEKMAAGLMVLIPTLVPDVIVVGGSIGTYFDRYQESLHVILRQHLEPQFASVDIRQAIHPEEAVIYGCYYYAVAQLDT